MKMYEKPIILKTEEAMEGIYLASGDAGAGGGGGRPGCDSIYMQGVWQAQDNSSWGNSTRGYKQQFGCLGCPANRGGGASDAGNGGCGLLIDQAYLDGATSYDVDNGNRKPEWERRGYGPDDTVTDWL